MAVTNVTPPVRFAPAGLLGLDAFGMAPDTDDVDELVLAENGTGGFEPSIMPFDRVGGETGAPRSSPATSSRRPSAARTRVGYFGLATIPTATVTSP